MNRLNSRVRKISASARASQSARRMSSTSSGSGTSSRSATSCTLSARFFSSTGSRSVSPSLPFISGAAATTLASDPCSRSSFVAVTSPMPRTPGMLSVESPRSASHAPTSGGGTPNFCCTRVAS